MKKAISILVGVLLTTVVAYASFEGLSAGSSLKIFNRINCGAGLTCTRTGNGLFNMVSSPTLSAGNLTIGDGSAADTDITYDGNAQDFYIGLDDSADDLLIGVGGTVGTTPALAIDENTDVSFAGNITMTGAIGLGAVATFTDSDATPDVSDGSYFNTNTSAVTITDFDGAGIYEGQVLVVVSKGAITYDVTSSGIVGGTTDIITAAGDVTSFIYDGTNWLVTARIDISDDLN